MTPESVRSDFEPAKKNIRWAQEAIQEVDLLAKRFFAGDVTGRVVELDPKTGENVAKIKLLRTFPDEFARKATEALLNSRHAFDQAMFAARNIASGPSNRSVYYPWAQSPSDLERIFAKYRIDERLQTVLRAHEPYGRSDAYAGGDDTIRALAAIANRKHTIGLSVNALIRVFEHPRIFGSCTSFRLTFPRWNSEKGEAEFARWRGDLKVEAEYGLHIQIGFKDSRLPQSVNAFQALADFARKAQFVAETLQARCLEIIAAP